jgi:hypothetical protein
MGRGLRAHAGRPRPEGAHRPDSGRVHGAVDGAARARAAKVAGGPTHRRHPGRDRARPRKPPGEVRQDRPGALVFPGIMGGPIRRGNFNKLAAWPHAVEALGMPGLHVHDLRHTGNQFAANSGAGLRDLMARMGHDSERAAMIYQHEARGADKAITDAIDKHVDDEQRQDDDGDDGPGGVPVPA